MCFFSTPHKSSSVTTFVGILQIFFKFLQNEEAKDLLPAAQFLLSVTKLFEELIKVKTIECISFGSEKGNESEELVESLI